MANVAQQVHGKFKLFTGDLTSRVSLDALIREVETFVRENQCAPKSIGVEYLEGPKRLLLSLGYRDDEPAYGITLSTVPLGRIGELAPPDVARLEKRLAEAAAAIKNVICHELFVTGDGECTMVFMAHGAG
jgi:hypothetical protein